jgi:hypothetical protein
MFVFAWIELALATVAAIVLLVAIKKLRSEKRRRRDQAE